MKRVEDHLADSSSRGTPDGNSLTSEQSPFKKTSTAIKTTTTTTTTTTTKTETTTTTTTATDNEIATSLFVGPGGKDDEDSYRDVLRNDHSNNNNNNNNHNNNTRSGNKNDDDDDDDDDGSGISWRPAGVNGEATLRPRSHSCIAATQSASELPSTAARAVAAEAAPSAGDGRKDKAAFGTNFFSNGQTNHSAVRISANAAASAYTTTPPPPTTTTTTTTTAASMASVAAARTKTKSTSVLNLLTTVKDDRETAYPTPKHKKAKNST